MINIFFAANTILGSAVIDSENNIYIASGNNVLCIKDDGNIKWKVPVRGFVGTSPSLSNDGIIFFTSYLLAPPFNYFHALNTNDGSNFFPPKGFGGTQSAYSSPIVRSLLF